MTTYTDNDYIRDTTEAQRDMDAARTWFDSQAYIVIGMTDAEARVSMEGARAFLASSVRRYESRMQAADAKLEAGAETVRDGD